MGGSTGVGKLGQCGFCFAVFSTKSIVDWCGSNAVRFRTGLQAAARDGATDYFVRRLVRAHVLYWDDLGQTHLTGAASEMLLHLIEERTTAARPILATTQYSGERLEAQFDVQRWDKGSGAG